jgi:hypothetical protein
VATACRPPYKIQKLIVHDPGPTQRDFEAKPDRTTCEGLGDEVNNGSGREQLSSRGYEESTHFESDRSVGNFPPDRKLSTCRDSRHETVDTFNNALMAQLTTAVRYRMSESLIGASLDARVLRTPMAARPQLWEADIGI